MKTQSFNFLFFTMILLMLAPVYAVEQIARVSSNAQTPQQRCNLFKKTANLESMSKQEKDDYTALMTHYNNSSNKAKEEPEKYILYITPNKHCDILEAGTIHLLNQEPCHMKFRGDGLEPNPNRKYCYYYPLLEIDKAIIQEFGRYQSKNFDGKYKIVDKPVPYSQVSSKTIYYNIDRQRDFGKYVIGFSVKGISNTGFSLEQKTKIYCSLVSFSMDDSVDIKAVNNGTQIVCSSEFFRKYDSSETDPDAACYTLNRYLNQMQKSPSDSSLVGASAEWKDIGTSVDTGKPQYGCVINVPGAVF